MDYSDEYGRPLPGSSRGQPRYDYPPRLPPSPRLQEYRNGADPRDTQRQPSSHSPRSRHLLDPSLRREYEKHEQRHLFDYELDAPSSSGSGLPGPKKRPAEAESAASLQGDVRSQPKARTGSTSSATKPPVKKNGLNDPPQPRRAAQACLRCRKQKLKCIGGWPCNRCSKSKNVCDFGRPGMGAPAQINGGGTTEANARLEQLESSVANLLAGLAGGNSKSAVHPNNEVPRPHEPVESKPNSYDGQSPYHHHSPVPWNSSIPPTHHVRQLDPPRSVSWAGSIAGAEMTPEDLVMPHHHVRFTSSPHPTFNQHGYSPSNLSSSGTGPSPASHARGEPVGQVSERKRLYGKRQKAEERLATATEAHFDEAPFKPLVYQPAVWDNREASRRSSPQPSHSSQSRDEPGPGAYDRRMMREKDDPVNTEIIDLPMAQTLFSFFCEHCHPFLPVVNVALDDAFNTIRQSPFLISAIAAVAARFYIKYTHRNPDSCPPLGASAPPRLANLAQSHLANTLLRKQHALSDVQAVMLLSAWGLESGGRGPDAWVMTGHAARIARRLGVHKVLGQAAETARNIAPGAEEWKSLEVYMPQWRTWLCWFCFDGLLSLGFGRPQSTQFETVDEQGFLQSRLNENVPRPGTPMSMSLYGDVYIAGQVQLTQIGRELVNWGEMLADPIKAQLVDPRRRDSFSGKEIHVKTMFSELNIKLDDWCKLWVWNAGSPYYLYLGSMARLARLQADHMRLCLNSFALKSDPHTDEQVTECLKKALNAAMATIQTHHESSQTDLALSFATDYVTITLAQAAIFLIRVAKAEPPIQTIIDIDPSVITHYLKMSIDLLQQGEISETRLSTYLARTIRDMARAAGLSGLGLRDGDDEDESRPQSARSGVGVGGHGIGGDGGDGKGGNPSGIAPAGEIAQGGERSLPPDLAFDMDNYLSLESQLNIGYLLGLPGDESAGMLSQLGGGQAPGAGIDGGAFNEFTFPLGAVAMGYGPSPGHHAWEINGQNAEGRGIGMM